ncbi:MAG: hypothetical protein NTY07_13050 [Bacteroidia bacterium]|nr:hypothetical protein [Bacteroidia bacterium]
MRDIRFFFLGVVTILLIEAIFDWKSIKSGFFDGLNDAPTETGK